MAIQTEYLKKLFNPKFLNTAIRKAQKRLSTVKFDAIAVRGNSGTIFGGALSAAMNKHLILVRKDTEDTHSSLTVEGEDKSRTYIFVDDIIQTGATYRAVRDDIAKSFRNMRCVGVYLYAPSSGPNFRLFKSGDDLL